MRKRVIATESADGPHEPGEWLDLEPIALVEISSEEPGHPIESALGAGGGPGWRAAGPGPQTIRLVFDQPQQIRRVRIVFREEARPRTQEFALRWADTAGGPLREIVRQQYTFSPPGTTQEVEEYRTDLAGVRILEVQISPDVSGGPAPATLAALQLA